RKVCPIKLRKRQPGSAIERSATDKDGKSALLIPLGGKHVGQVTYANVLLKVEVGTFAESAGKRGGGIPWLGLPHSVRDHHDNVSGRGGCLSLVHIFTLRKNCFWIGADLCLSAGATAARGSAALGGSAKPSTAAACMRATSNLDRISPPA